MSKTMYIATEVVTPAIAQRWLERHDRNRPIRTVWVEQLARAMTDGKFQVNGETIKIGTDGSLLDGQHRLSAIVKSGVSVTMAVARNVPPDSFSTIDSGRSRSMSDVLMVQGMTNAHWLSATAGWLYLYMHDSVRSFTKARANRSELLDIIADHPGLPSFYRADCALFRGSGFSRSARGMVEYLTFSSSPTQSESFWNAVDSGADLERGSPMLTLRDRLIRGATQRGRRSDAPLMIAYAIKAWNAFHAGEEVFTLKFADAEVFPLVLGCPFNPKREKVKAKPASAQ